MLFKALGDFRVFKFLVLEIFLRIRGQGLRRRGTKLLWRTSRIIEGPPFRGLS